METFTRDGLVFDVRDGGPRHGEVVICLHGFPQDASSWDAVVPRLHAAGLRTLVPDQRGYSPGARPRAVRRYAMAELVDDVLALADAARVASVHLVGHDWGAGVAWEVARRHPRRVLTLTALSVPHPRAMLAAAPRSRQGARSLYMLAFQARGIEWVMAPGLADGLERAGLGHGRASHYGVRFGHRRDLAGPLAWYRALPLGLFDPATWRQPFEVTVPTTFAWGSRDPYVDRASAERCGRHVVAPYRFVELDAGHWLPENAPDAVADLVLERVAGPRWD